MTIRSTGRPLTVGQPKRNSHAPAGIASTVRTESRTTGVMGELAQ
jgi:hypothetical protein